MATEIKRRYVYVATIVAMISLVGGFALAAYGTGIITGTSLTSTGTGTTSPIGNGLSIASPQLLAYDPALGPSGVCGGVQCTLGTPEAGAPEGALAGTPTQVWACTTNPCDAGAAFEPEFQTTTPAAGDYSEQVLLYIPEPTGGTAGSPASAFELSITFYSSGTTVLVTANALVTVPYVTTAATVHVYLYVDTGSNAAPSVSSFSVAANACSSATACP